MVSRKDKRLESKVKKVRAFLIVARLNQEEKEKNTNMQHKNCKRHLHDDVCPVINKKCKESKPCSLIDVTTDRLELPLRMLTEEERREKIELRKAAMECPKIYLTLKDLAEEYVKRMSNVMHENDKIKEDIQPPLFAVDLQSLLLCAVEGSHSSYYPRWCRLLRQNRISSVVVMVIDGVSLSEVKKYKDCFTYLTSNIPMHIEMTSPMQHDSSIEKEVFKVRLSESQWLFKVREAKYHPSSWHVPNTDSVHSSIISGKHSDMVPKNPIDIFDRRLLLLNLIDMVHDGYPLPVIRDDIYKHFKYTKEEYEEVTANSPIFAVDCEMCLSHLGRELSRISVVNEKLEILMDKLVKPRNPIIDYSTRYSGVTELMLRNVTTRLEDIQKEFQQIIPADAILVGHSFCNDLIAMEMFHPYVIDTSVIYNLGKKNYKPGLSTLTRHFLKKHIQISLAGHSPVEDAIATMELTLLKLRTGKEYGDILSGCTETAFNLSVPIGSSKALSTAGRTVRSGASVYFNPTDDELYQSIFNILKRVNKSSAVISKPDILPEKALNDSTFIPGSDDSECVKKAVEVLKEKQFVWLNLRDVIDHKEEFKDIANRKVKFTQLDNNIKDIKEHSPSKSLFICVFSGNMKRKAGVYVCIT